MDRNKENPQPGDSVEVLERMEDETFTRYGTDSRPAGKTWAYMVLDLARAILDEGLAITKDDLNQLTEDNFHTARTAAEIVLQLIK